MTDTPIEEQIATGLDYDLVEGQKPARRYDNEMFISHNTKKIDTERTLVRKVNNLLKKPNGISTFFDEKDMGQVPIKLDT